MRLLLGIVVLALLGASAHGDNTTSQEPNQQPERMGVPTAPQEPPAPQDATPPQDSTPPQDVTPPPVLTTPQDETPPQVLTAPPVLTAPQILTSPQDLTASGNSSQIASTSRTFGEDPSQIASTSRTFGEDPSQIASTSRTFGENWTACSGSHGKYGTCKNDVTCKKDKGTPDGSCMGGLGVCCVMSLTCGDKSYENNTFFANQDFPEPNWEARLCEVEIKKKSSKISQIMIEFDEFELAPPNHEGECITDVFQVKLASGRPSPYSLLRLCGQNTGQHMYLDVSQIEEPLVLSVATSGGGFPRRYSIRIVQMDDKTYLLAPPGCLQYYTDTIGHFRSFNLGQNLKNLYYAICFRIDNGYSGIRFSSNFFGMNGHHCRRQKPHGGQQRIGDSTFDAPHPHHLVIPPPGYAMPPPPPPQQRPPHHQQRLPPPPPHHHQQRSHTPLPPHHQQGHPPSYGRPTYGPPTYHSQAPHHHHSGGYAPNYHGQAPGYGPPAYGSHHGYQGGEYHHKEIDKFGKKYEHLEYKHESNHLNKEAKKDDKWWSLWNKKEEKKDKKEKYFSHHEALFPMMPIPEMPHCEPRYCGANDVITFPPSGDSISEMCGNRFNRGRGPKIVSGSPLVVYVSNRGHNRGAGFDLNYEQVFYLPKPYKK